MSLLLRLAAAAAFATSLSVSSAVPVDDEYKLVIQEHRFRPAEIVVPAGTKIKLVIENRDPTPEEFESHALNREKVIAGKSMATIFIGPLKPGRYPFVGEYNEKSAHGVIVVQ